MSAKKLKQRIHDGELIYGVSVPASANRDEMKAIINKDHYDYVMADSQHAAYDARLLVEYYNIALRTRLIYRFIFGLSTPVTLTLSATPLIWDHRGWKCLK